MSLIQRIMSPTPTWEEIRVSVGQWDFRTRMLENRKEEPRWQKECPRLSPPHRERKVREWRWGSPKFCGEKGEGEGQGGENGTADEGERKWGREEKEKGRHLQRDVERKSRERRQRWWLREVTNYRKRSPQGPTTHNEVKISSSLTKKLGKQRLEIFKFLRVFEN